MVQEERNSIEEKGCWMQSAGNICYSLSDEMGMKGENPGTNFSICCFSHSVQNSSFLFVENSDVADTKKFTAIVVLSTGDDVNWKFQLIAMPT